MVESLQISLLVLAVFVSLADVLGLKKKTDPGNWIRKIATRRRLVIAALVGTTFLGCLAVAGVLHEPVPRVQDEFSYLLMSNTFARVHVANPTPPLSEFFETYHVLVRPAYVSKYYPAQGIFLALGEKLTRHPAVGLWLSSALACAATSWMLQAWITPLWGMVGGLLVMLQLGVFSYWSQTYWGGMVAALGGALFFGALRRLWERPSWSSALWLSAGIVILVNSRPAESILAIGIAGAVLLYRVWRLRQWATGSFWHSLVLPAGAVLLLGAAATLAYNHAITGSAFLSPYVEHERQYQETPPFVFLPLRPPITYSDPALRKFYEDTEISRYDFERNFWPCSVAFKLGEWWNFYCGILLSVPLLVPVILRRGWPRYLQLAVLAGIGTLVVMFKTAPPDSEHLVAILASVDVLAILQVVLLWVAFDGFWPRLAIAITVPALLLGFTTKWWFAHYTAPVACLCWFLQVEGLRRMWNWHSGAVTDNKHLPHRERRRAAAERGGWKGAGATLSAGLRNLVYLFPILCALSLVGRVALRKSGASRLDTLPDWETLVNDPKEWSLRRAAMERQLEQQASPQLVFVQYRPTHHVALEWVHNDADLEHAKVVWARDLGAEHNRLLLAQMPGRTVWSLDGDNRNPQLVPYSESIAKRFEESAGAGSRLDGVN
jgi:hypothetical protein